MYSFKKEIKSCTSINFLAYIYMYIGKKGICGDVIIARLLPWKLLNLFRISLTRLRVNIKIKHPYALFFTLYIFLKKQYVTMMLCGLWGNKLFSVVCYCIFRMISYWTKIIHGQENKTVFTVYKYWSNRDINV